MIFILCFSITVMGMLATFLNSSTRASVRILGGVTVLNLVALAWGFKVWAESNTNYFISNHFVSDATSRLFLVLINVVLIGFTPYVINRIRTNQLTAKNISLFVRLVLLFLALCIVVIFSNHLILMWIALEGTSLAVAPLIYHQRGKVAFRAAWKYLVFSTVGLSLTFLGLVFLSHAIQNQIGESASTFFLHELKTLDLHRTIWTDLAIFFSVLGLGTKLGLAPMYSWLPETYDSAPPSITALLAAVQFNCAIVMLFRLVPILRAVDDSLLSTLLISVGLISIAAATINIVVTRSYKRLISYAAINHAGVIALGLGIGRNANYGVLLYVLSNALVKAILFFTAGNIKAKFGTKHMPDLQGLIKDMPYSGGFFAVGIFALLGFAPFGSFIGEVMIMSSMIDVGNWFAFTALCLLIVVSFVATGRSVFPMIWGEPKLQPHERGESIYTLIPNLFYLVLLLSMGIYIPQQANGVLIQVAEMLGGR